MEEMNELKMIYEKCPLRIKRQFEECNFIPKERIISQQEKHVDAFIIIEGNAKVSILTKDGKTVAVYVLKPWEIFGETELFNTEISEFNVETLTPCRVIRIHRSHYFEWLKEDFNLVLYTLKQLSAKLYRSANLVMRNTLYPLEYRFLVLIFEYANEKGVISQFPKETMEELLGTSGRCLNRLIGSLESKKLITYKGGVIRIIDMPLLKDAIEAYK